MYPEADANHWVFLLVGLLSGILIGILWTSMVFYPGLAKGLARIKGAFLLAVGAGLLVWGIVTLATDSQFLPPFRINFMRTAVECIAWGAGVFAIGLLTFILGFVGVLPKREAVNR